MDESVFSKETEVVDKPRIETNEEETEIPQDNTKTVIVKSVQSQNLDPTIERDARADKRIQKGMKRKSITKSLQDQVEENFVSNDSATEVRKRKKSSKMETSKTLTCNDCGGSFRFSWMGSRLRDILREESFIQ